MNRHPNDRDRLERNMDDPMRPLATGLGWFSIALGAAELAAPRKVAQLIGAPETEATDNLLRFYGLRELAAGLGILNERQQPAPWLWSRVGGDLLDLATLGALSAADGSNRTRLATAAGAVIGVSILDALAAGKMGTLPENRGRQEQRHPGHVTASIVVNKPLEQVYSFWRNFENLPRFMKYVESVRVYGDRRSHWVAKAPGGKTYEWDAETVDDIANARIAWTSLPNADVHNCGTVQFTEATAGRGTVVRVEMEYAPPGGRLGALLAKLMQTDPGQLAKDDLRRFKQVMETGEVVQSDASVHEGMHPAQPPERQIRQQVPVMAF